MKDDWAEFLVALLEANARFLVVGAHAMAVHGVPRGTQDLDVWVEPTAENSGRVWQALASFGVPLHTMTLTPGDFERPDTVVQFGVAPTRVDVLTSVSGVPDFAGAWAGREQHEVHGHTVPFIGRAALVANKRAAGRPKDLADLEALGEGPG